MGTITHDDCIACHKSQIVNKDGYCDGCQGRIDWFFSKENKTNKAVPFYLKRYKVSPFWQILFFFICMLITAIVIGFGMDLL